MPRLPGEPAQLELGPATRERACRVLEQQLGAVWAAVLETHGHDPAGGFRVVLPAVLLEPLAGQAAPEAGGNGWTAGEPAPVITRGG